jgi:hypothetical protein
MSIKAGLKGDSIDLGILAGLLPHPADPSVEVEAGGYFLTSATLPDALIDDGARLHQQAGELLRHVVGAARVLDSSFRPVELSGTFKDSTGHQHAVVTGGTASARSHLTATAVVISSDSQLPPPPVAPTYVQRAGSDADVGDALNIMGKPEPLDWYDLYKLFEIVRDNVDPPHVGSNRQGSIAKLVDTGWITDAERRAFTASANHQLASGDAARHARLPGEAPKQTISLAEGRDLIKRLLRSWLDSLA